MSSKDKCISPVMQAFLSRGGRVGLHLARSFSMSHGEKPVSSQAPGIAWSSYTTGALLETIQQITDTLKKREELSGSSGSSVWDLAGDSGAAGAQQPEYNSQDLRKPWTCGYSCRWCDEPCQRKEGHTYHSCFEHRHRR